MAPGILLKMTLHAEDEVIVFVCLCADPADTLSTVPGTLDNSEFLILEEI